MILLNCPKLKQPPCSECELDTKPPCPSCGQNWYVVMGNRKVCSNCGLCFGLYRETSDKLEDINCQKS